MQQVNIRWHMLIIRSRSAEKELKMIKAYSELQRILQLSPLPVFLEILYLPIRFLSCDLIVSPNSKNLMYSNNILSVPTETIAPRSLQKGFFLQQLTYLLPLLNFHKTRHQFVNVGTHFSKIVSTFFFIVF